jgi:cobaltochelatase CobN
MQKCYIREVENSGIKEWHQTELKRTLASTTDEIESVLSALDGRFISPGPGGHLARGKIDCLPTGRNFYGINLRCIPTPAAFEVGQEMGQQLLRKYLNEEGRFPGHIGMVLWSSDVFRSEGELITHSLPFQDAFRTNQM